MIPIIRALRLVLSIVGLGLVLLDYVCCSVLQCVAVCCSVLQCGAVHFVLSFALKESERDQISTVILTVLSFALKETFRFGEITFVISWFSE